ncbi:hypothetical protein D3C73_655890 [compost metagenome]
MQQQWHQERQGTAAQAGEQVAENADGERSGLEQRRREQRIINVPGPQPVSRQARHAAKQQQHHSQVRQVQLAQALHGDGDQNHRRTEQQEAEAVEARAFAAAQVGDEFPHGVAADGADRQVDEEDPVPGQVLDHPAAHGRANQWTEQARNGDEAHDPHQFRARVSAQYHQAPDRQHQCATQALDHPGANQHAQAARQCAEQ